VEHFVQAPRYKSEGHRFDCRLPHYGPRVDSTSSKKWVPGVPPGG